MSNFRHSEQCYYFKLGNFLQVILVVSVEPCICRKISAAIIHYSIGAEQCKTLLGKQKQYIYLLSIYFFI